MPGIICRARGVTWYYVLCLDVRVLFLLGNIVTQIIFIWIPCPRTNTPRENVESASVLQTFFLETRLGELGRLSHLEPRHGPHFTAVVQSLEHFAHAERSGVITHQRFRLGSLIFFVKNWKTSAVSTTDRMVKTQLCKLRGTSCTIVGYAWILQ